MKWYKYDIRDLSKAEYEKWYSLMTMDKQQRVDRFRFADDRKRTVAGEMLARKAIAEWCHVSEEEIQFGKSEYGKPFAIGLDVEFNISHSGDMVVCAVDNDPVGIDVELIRPIDLNVIQRICTENEITYVLGDNLSKNSFCKITNYSVLSRFFEIWTLKEAYGKLMGTGITERCVGDVSILCNVTRYMLDGYIVTIGTEL